MVGSGSEWVPWQQATWIGIAANERKGSPERCESIRSCSAIFYPGMAEIDINNYNPYLVGNVFALFTPLGPLVPVTLYVA